MALFINAMLFVFLTARPTSSRRIQDRKKVSLHKDSVGDDLEIISLQAMHEPKTLEDFQKLLVEAKDNKTTVIVDFTATWCGPCQRIKPFFEELEQKFPHVLFCKIDVDENTETAQKYEVSAMPTFMAFREEKEVGQIQGADPDALKKLVENHQGIVWGKGYNLDTVSASENGEATSLSKSDESQTASQSASESSASAREKRLAALAKRGL